MGGEVRGPGPRSLSALEWVERLDVVGLEALGLAHGWGRRAAYSHASRLAEAGLVLRLPDREGALVAITVAGRRRACPSATDFRGLRRGGLRSSAAHARAVSWVAARATLHDRPWVSEREMRRGGWCFELVWTERRTHRADLGLTSGGSRVAVEVELTAKAPARLRAILAGYSHQIHSGALDRVVYVCDDPLVAGGVARAAARTRLGPEELRHVELREVITDVRTEAGKRRTPTKRGEVEAA